HQGRSYLRFFPPSTFPDRQEIFADVLLENSTLDYGRLRSLYQIAWDSETQALRSLATTIGQPWTTRQEDVALASAVTRLLQRSTLPPERIAVALSLPNISLEMWQLYQTIVVGATPEQIDSLRRNWFTIRPSRMTDPQMVLLEDPRKLENNTLGILSGR